MSGPIVQLTPRQLAVLAGFADGLTYAQIGRLLDISPATVRVHGSRMYRLLGARSQAHAVAIGFRMGLIGGAS